MDEDSVPKPPIQEPKKDTSNPTEEEETSTFKVFDITPDLNISPAKDEPENVPVKLDISNIITGENIEPPQINPAPKISNQESKPFFGPANPPAKTIGQNKTYFTDKPEDKTPQVTTLQEAVASMDKKPNEQQKPVFKNIDPNIKTIRTYERDFAEAISKRKLSKSSFVIAENEKKINEKKTNPPTQENIEPSQPRAKNRQPGQSHVGKNILIGSLSAILVFGGLYAGYYLYTKSIFGNININIPFSLSFLKNITTPKSDVGPIQKIGPSVVGSDSKITIPVDGKNKNKIIEQINQELTKNEKEDSIKEIILTETKDNETQRLSIKKFIEGEQTFAPEIFKRSLTDRWMLGIYYGKNQQNSAFVILTNDFFQNNFAGIIQWEKNMITDLEDYLLAKTSQITDLTLRGKFIDKIIKNRDVREYIEENGHIIFLYSFISNDKLVISNNEEALAEIITRLEKASFIR